MSLTRAVLRFAAPLPRVEAFRRYLFIGPHPDDIEVGAGATAAVLADAGRDVCFLVAADGRYGDGASGGVRGDALAALRQEEARKSAAMLGVRDVRFLELCDGGFYDFDELLRGVARVVGEFKPDIILAPDPCVASECHIDHLNVGNAARRIACFAAYPSIMERYGAASAPVAALAYYMTARPNRFVKTSGYLERQLSAIFDCHASQFPRGCGEARAIGLYLRLRSADFGLRSFTGCAEGFRVLGATHMHCLPEAGGR